MKALATYKRKSINEEGDLEVTFAISNYYSKMETNVLEKDKVYTLDIEKKKERRHCNKIDTFGSCVV